jgi:phosphatidylserine/phosphatidylglycerophosphate/cardiolipin synthase-like enzyme
MVLTGSTNWSSLSTANDEVWFTIKGARVAKKYLNNFNYQWNNRRNTRNAYTTSYANFRVRRTVENPDGTTRTVWRTVRRKVTTVEPDNYRKGPYWEDD